MNDRFDSLFHRAKKEQLPDEDLAMVASELLKPNPGADVYALLYTLGRGGGLAYRDLVEQFLQSEENPSLASLSLRILCSYWNNTSQYIDRVLEFLRGVPWDEYRECRLAAIGIAGEHIRVSPQTEFLQELMNIYEDENENRLLRKAAYRALARGMGRGWKEIPSAARSFDLTEDIDQTVLDQAIERLDR
jgi:hypothetical protein